MATITAAHPRVWSFGRLGGWARALGSGIGAAGDGLVVGLVVAFILLAAASAPTLFLGIPDAIAIGLIGGLTTAVALVAAAVAILAGRAVHRLTRAATSSRALTGRPRVSALVAIPDRLIGSLPIGWLAAFAAFLWIALVGRTTFAPIAILTPAGSTVPYLYLSGVAGAILGVARHTAEARAGGTVPGSWRRRTSGALALMAAALLVAGGSVAWWRGDAGGIASTSPE